MFLTLLHNSTRCTGRVSSNVFGTSLRHPSTSTASPFRRYTTSKTSPKSPPRRIASTKPPVPTRSAGRPVVVLSENSALRKIQIAELLLKTGDRTLYKSTVKTTFFRAFAYSLTIVAAFGITTLYASGFLSVDTFRDLGHDSPVLVYSAFAITSIFLGAAAGWALFRTWNHVHRINLIEKTGTIFLQVTVRSGVPFMKRQLTIKPQDMVVDHRYVAAFGLHPMLVPVAPTESSTTSVFFGGVVRESIKAISRFFYNIFDAARVFFSQEGIMTVDIKQEKKGRRNVEIYFLDTSALFLQENNKIVLWDLIDTKDPYGYR